MGNYPDIEFVETSTETIVAALIAGYEKLIGRTVYPASPERLFILWIANIIVQERVNLNWAAKMNLPRYAEGEFLDSLAELFHNVSREPASAATTTMRFYLSEAQGSAQLVPKGTRISVDEEIVFATTEELYIAAGTIYGDVKAECQTAGEAGNGFLPGQITQLVDIYPYYQSCENITQSEGGAAEEGDKSLYQRMRQSEDTYSTAGPKGGYEYWAKKTSTAIADVKANSPTPGTVCIYVLMEDGELPGTEILEKVETEVNADEVRPLTDSVQVLAPEVVPYDIDLTYYLASESETSASVIEVAVESAVSEYITWQSAKMGRDINPSKLTSLLMATGIKRVDIRAPVFQAVHDGAGVLAAEVAQFGNRNVLNGGYEDE